MAEGIDPELAFRLVKLESDFNPRATSHVGAIGLTQMMLPTARYYERASRARALRSEHQSSDRLPVSARLDRSSTTANAKLALLVYNRGEVAVNNALQRRPGPVERLRPDPHEGLQGKGVVE